MSSDFIPVNMRNRIGTEDTSYLRQNQPGTQGKTGKVAPGANFIPSNDEIKSMVDNAIQMVKQNRYPDRGSILNILV